MGDQPSKMSKEKQFTKSKTVDMNSSVTQPFDDKPKKTISQKKTFNSCPDHEEEQISFVCLLSQCRSLMCSKCAKTHVHKKKEELSENLCGKFQFLRFLGQGGCGKVFSVQHNFENFAIKVVDIFADVDESITPQRKNEYLQDYTAEAKIHQELRQQYIVNYYDHFYIEEEERLVIKMELADSSLFAEIDDLNKSQALIWFAQICSGVNYLHEKNIIHRDLKPGNILIKEGRVKICDFGGAKLLTQTRVSTSKKDKGLFLGTQEYLAPEIFSENVKKFTKATDIWALGVIFFKMLNNKQHPFSRGENEENDSREEKNEKIKNRMEEYRDNETKFKRMVSTIYMGDIIGKCLQYRANDRIEMKNLLGLLREKLDDADLDVSTVFTKSSRTNTEVSVDSNRKKENSNIKAKVTKQKNREEEKKTENSLSENSEAYNIRANKYFVNKEYEKALKEYDLAISDKPYAKYYCNKATCLFWMNMPKEALKSVNQCLKLDPKYIKGYARKGKILIMQKDFQAAIKVFEEGLKVDKSNQDCKEGLASIPQEKSNEAEKLKQKAEEFYIEGKFNNALSEISNAIQLYSEKGDFFVIKAKIQCKLKEYNQAIITAQRAIDLDSYTAKEAYEIQADSFLNLKRLDEAITAYNKVLKSDPNNQNIKAKVLKLKEDWAEQLFDKSNNFHQEKKFQSALDYINQALNIFPQKIKYIFKKAKIEDDKNDKKTAIQTLITILEIEKTNPEAYLLIGKIFIDLKQVQIALQCFMEGLRENPFHVGLLNCSILVSKIIDKAKEINNEGVNLYNQGHFSLAMQKFDEAITINPALANVHFNKANTFIMMKNYSLALESNKKCLEVDKNFIQGYSQKGTIYLGLGNKSLAEQAFNEGLKIDSNDGDCRKGLINLNGNKNLDDLMGLLLLGALLDNSKQQPQQPQQLFFLNKNNNRSNFNIFEF